MSITPLKEAMRRLNDVPAQTRMEVIRGVTVRRKKNGLTVLSLHYSAIPDRDPLTPKGQAWFKRAHSKYASEARWKKEQEIDPYATGGEAVFGQVLSKYYQVVVISDQYWAPDPRWDVIGGFDHGSTNATCLLKAYVPREEFDPATGRKKAPDVYLCGEFYSYRREGWQNNVDQNVLMMKGGKNDAGDVFEGMPDMDRARWIMADPSIFWNTKVEEKGAPTNIYSTYKKNGMFPLRSYDGIRSDITFVEWIMSDYWRGIANGRKPRLYIVCRNPSDRPQPGLHPYDCPNLLWELKRAKRVEMTARQLLTKNPSENLQDKHNHARDCLSGDTLITTRAGLVPICDVQVGSEVLTRKGWRVVEDAWLAEESAKVYRVSFANGTDIIGTAGHKVFVADRGFLRVDELKYGMMAVCSRASTDQPKPACGWESDSIGIQKRRPTQNENTSRQGASISTFSSGYLRTVVRFQPGITSTISTGTRGTMNHRTLKLRNRWPISQTTTGRGRIPVSRKSLGSTSIVTKQPIGTAAPKEKPGTASTGAGWYTHCGTRPVLNAGSNSKTGIAAKETLSALRTAAHAGAMLISSMRLNVSVNSAQPHSALTSTIERDFAPELAPVKVVAVQPISERRAVYDLTVQGEPEFFANGILVHNCFKYMTGMLRNPTEIPYEEALNEELSKLDLTTASIRARFLMSSLAREGKLDPVTGQPRKGKAPRQIDLRRGPGVVGRR